MRTILFSAVVLLAGAAAPAEEPIRICTTVTDLASIAREIGGAEVEVVSFAKGTEDAHFVDARPSFVKALSGAELYIENGLELEIGWAPVLRRNARNPAVMPGGAGYLDASRAVTVMDVPGGAVDRSMGDVHPAGNPHYLADPVNGLKVAALIRDKLAAMRPGSRGAFDKNYESFKARIGAALVGEKLAGLYDVRKLALLADNEKLQEFLAGQNQSDLLGGWLGKCRTFRGAQVVADHNMWPYFAGRFGVRIAGFMEPKPGVSPTTSQLGKVVELMKRQGIQTVITGAYFDPRHARFLAERTGAKVAVLAHQTGAADGASDYIAMIDHNVSALLAALNGGK